MRCIALAAVMPVARSWQLSSACASQRHTPLQLAHLSTQRSTSGLRAATGLDSEEDVAAAAGLNTKEGVAAAAAGLDSEEGVAAAAGPLATWWRRDVLQGVSPSSETYAIMVVYFVQGALGLASLARTYFLKDELHLSPADVAALQGLFILPWTIKPLYGFVSDGLPLFGYRRKSYLMLAGALGSSSWLALSTVVTTAPQALAASLLASLSVAVSDVVVDSIVVERARDDPSASSGALQSLCWSSQALGGLASAYFSGSLLEIISARSIFQITAVFPLLVVAMALQLKETRRDARGGGFAELVQSQTSLLWGAVKQRKVWLPALFIFLWQATPSSGTAFFYFITDLGITPEQLGRVQVGSSIASLAGIWAYRTYLQDVPIKTTLFWITVASAPIGLTQLILISHLNRDLGISDFWFTFGDDVVLTVLGQLAFMPLLVLAAALCPPGIEGTLFATLMSLFNGAGVIGSELGALLTEAFGITESNFDNLAALVTVCNLSSLLPLLAIDWLDQVRDPALADAALADAALADAALADAALADPVLADPALEDVALADPVLAGLGDGKGAGDEKLASRALTPPES